MVMRLDVMALNDVLCKRRHRTKRQSKTTKILLANNFVAIIQLFEYNKYQFYTFLLEPLAKKVCSVSFVSQYKSYRQIVRIPIGKFVLLFWPIRFGFATKET